MFARVGQHLAIWPRTTSQGHEHGDKLAKFTDERQHGVRVVLRLAVDVAINTLPFHEANAHETVFTVVHVVQFCAVPQLYFCCVRFHCE